MASRVQIQGDGVAARCCVRLLRVGGLEPVLKSASSPKVPAVMLGQASQTLLRDIFGRQDLFDGCARIFRRVVSWGADFAPRELPHSAVVISEQELIGRLSAEPIAEGCGGQSADWTIFTSRRLPSPWIERHLGSRMATASAVGLQPKSSPETCWVESLECGWLFLLPSGGGRAWLLSVGDPVAPLLAESRLVARQIGEIESSRGGFPAHPRIADPLCGGGWLVCGTAALGFDPICGEGVGQAAREAILASAVIAAAKEGSDRDAVVEHYRSRLILGFERHLEVCREYYEAGRSGPWWDRQLDLMRDAGEWRRNYLGGAAAGHYRLCGFRLERVHV